MRFGENCPSVCYFNFNTYSARGRFQLGQIILDNDAEYSEEVMSVVHNCTTCGSCDVTCKICRYNLEPLDHNIALKKDAVQRGMIYPEQRAIIQNLMDEKTMLVGKKKADRTLWAEGLGLKDIFKEQADVAFFPGCKYSYDEKLTETARFAVSLLLDLGVDLGFLGDAETCCAGRAHQMGFEQEFDARAKANIKAFQKAGIKTIVTPCSDCFHTFKRLYAQKGMKIQVLHIIEYIDKLMTEGKLQLTKDVNLTVTYHDPCHLGRQGEPYVPWQGKEKKIRKQIHTWEPRRPRFNGAYGVYDAPRNILRAIKGVNLVEMERIREYSWCCGAGGGCSETNQDFSLWTASERITEARSTGAQVLVTACPWCESNFSAAVDENGYSMEVLDILDLLKMAL
jgi:Fe-S oxidoreductase